ncbi:MAG: YeeE/YedE thiosulfate transporter family protein [Kiritimatiellia bacterium]
MEWKPKGGGWNPYLAGALVGLLAIASAWATTAVSESGRTSFLGASTTFVRTAGYVHRVIAPGRVAENPYYDKVKPRVDWQFMVVIGIFLGALIASLTDRSFQLEATPPVWRERFGASTGVRAVGAVLGGIVAMIGARLADGCPSGHGLSGLMQLSVSGFVALACFFGSGVVVAQLVFKGGKKHE